MKYQKKKYIISITVILAPIIVFIVGVIEYYRQSVDEQLLFIEWIVTRYNIASIFNNEALIGDRFRRLFWNIWIIAFALSLFTMGKYFNDSKKNVNKDAILKDKDPYIKAQYIYQKLKETKKENNLKELDQIIYRIKIIEEQLSVESDFGYGDSELILCENEISKNLNQLMHMAGNIHGSVLHEDITMMYKAISEINVQLRKRQELERK